MCFNATNMATTKYEHLTDSVGKKVTLLGWVDKVKEQKRFTFITLRMGLAQTVQVVSSVKGVTPESFLQVSGVVSKLPEGAYSTLPVEIQCESDGIVVISPADSSYSTRCPPEAGPEVRLVERHLYLRDPQFALITRLRGILMRAIRAHFDGTGCTEITPPSFTGVECEGGATLFKVEHPGVHSDKPMMAYLTQSSQFSLEFAVPAVGDCYCIAPSFRAEHSHTRRHLTEFTHAESEWMGVRTLDDHLGHLRDMMRGILRHFLDFGEETLTKLGVVERVRHLYGMTHDIVVLEHRAAIAKCAEMGIMKDDGTPFGERDDIPEKQERELIDKLDKIVFLVKFPKEFKSFYMALDPEDPTRVLGCDVEVPGVGEIVGSGVREGDYTRLTARLLESGLKPEDYAEYLDMRKFGFGMTSGMGLGVDRMLTWLLGKTSIREVVTFPRFPGYLRP